MSTSPGLDGLVPKTTGIHSPCCQLAGNHLAVKQEQKSPVDALKVVQSTLTSSVVTGNYFSSTCLAPNST